MRLIKKVCSLLKKHDLINADWLLKHVEEIDAKNVDLGLMISAKIESHDAHRVLDTGSTFTLLPNQIWK